MKLLLDTPIALWAAGGAPQLSTTAAALIEHPENTLYVSAASIWEIAIKYRKGNLPVHPRDARSAFRLAGFAELPISSDHVEGVAALPDFPDHADPFDRVMVAQALHEGMPLVSADPKLWRYHATLVLRA
ncbi:type II toxin-antitoxin system VapC family toxin [Burkholderia multivorans]|uniref:type II toxin-antitoxin system VapC family toxin n=1 Tax=Burkholderia multivorans TaxID=87883 RepID=UPI000DAE9819|nr:type II toxin-antitoxin system VapC family toxin [Burkholderia multivorans]MBR8047690.1 type II toxin-antitoxin system VapC family toxin [Burkholderia multivorans]RAA20837.1 type II toxin-antitoxin system VapC family toxin [Burkholderia multivorans]RAA21872.1 type II toxin-antitoxin system VapC family toxin [Burkholderia multivorans]RAA26516.1 type II toxin-antitoxin system VapC family toxin [Burkholderia multivorans]RAA36460.1 type II toxin-antitoxin system VapC family toxin [Burkholderia 